MKIPLVFAAIIASALAARVDDSKNAVILRYESNIIGDDGYYFE